MLYTCVSLSLVWVLLGLAQGFSVQYESDAFFPTEFGRGDSPSTDYTMNTQKRYGISRDCHRYIILSINQGHECSQAQSG